MIVFIVLCYKWAHFQNVEFSSVSLRLGSVNFKLGLIFLWGSPFLSQSLFSLFSLGLSLLGSNTSLYESSAYLAREVDTVETDLKKIFYVTFELPTSFTLCYTWSPLQSWWCNKAPLIHRSFGFSVKWYQRYVHSLGLSQDSLSLGDYLFLHIDDYQSSQEKYCTLHWNLCNPRKMEYLQ